MSKKTTIKQSKIVDQHHEPKIKIKKIHDAQGNSISLEAQFPLVARENESGTWIIYSPHFKTYGYSNKSEVEATEKFKIALDIFFKVHNNKGTLEKALLEFGWHKINNELKKPKLFNGRITRGSIKRSFNLDTLPSLAAA